MVQYFVFYFKNFLLRSAAHIKLAKDTLLLGFLHQVGLNALFCLQKLQLFTVRIEKPWEPRNILEIIYCLYSNLQTTLTTKKLSYYTSVKLLDVV